MENTGKNVGRQTEQITEHWFVYRDDPIVILYTDETGTANRVKYARKQYAEEHFTPEENTLLRELRKVYPDESADWWMHYEEIRQVLFELFPKNEKYLAILKPKAQAEKDRPVQESVPKHAPASEPGPADAAADLQRDMQAGDDSARFKWMEMLDDQQIVDYLEGRLVEELFYEFEVGGRPVIGISFAGTIEAAKTVSAQKMKSGGGIEVLPDVRVEEIDDGAKYAAYVRAIDKGINFVVMGYADQDKLRYNKMKRKLEIDPFARRSVVSKAQRNALRHLIPEQEILAMYREWKRRKTKPAKEPGRA